MPQGFVVREPFTRRGKSYAKGHIINNREEVEELKGSDHAHHLIATQVEEEPAAVKSEPDAVPEKPAKQR